MLRPYPRHDAQDSVWLPHQGVRVEGAPGFARSVRTPFHRGCTARRPPLGAHRRPVRVRGASAPSPARGWCGWGLPPGGVRARQAKLGARAMVGVSVPGGRAPRQRDDLCKVARSRGVDRECRCVPAFGSPPSCSSSGNPLRYLFVYLFASLLSLSVPNRVKGL